jgi:hypothetical protein
MQIALDVLPCHASSVPCEHLFSASKQAADQRQSSLGAKCFEELQVLKFTWHNDTPNKAVQNSALVEEVLIDEYCDLLEAEEMGLDWDKQFSDADEFVLED